MDLNFLKDKNLAIIGHDNADVDSIVSGVMTEKLFNYLGINSRFLITDAYIETKISSILLKYGIDVSMYPSKITEEYLFLVDHHETQHCGIVLGVIDHHKSTNPIECPFYINSTSASASMHVYRLMKYFNYPFLKEDINLILIAAYTDSCSLKSSKVMDLDRNEIEYLISKYNIDECKLYEDGLLIRKLFEMSIEDILNNGLKKYNTKDTIFNSSYLRIDCISSLKEFELQIVLAVREFLSKQENTISFWVFVFACIKDNKTVVLHISTTSVETYVHEGILSRGKDIIPSIKEKNTILAV